MIVPDVNFSVVGIWNKGAFTNYVYKTRQLGVLKMSTFCQHSYHKKCQRKGVGGQKSQNLDNEVFEQPLALAPVENFQFAHDCTLQSAGKPK